MDQFVSTNGIRLHYLDHTGGTLPIVLLPGLTANAHAFDGLVQAGLSPRFRTLALDLRGRGLSDAPADGYTLADHARDVIGLLDALGLEQVVLGGHSFGGFLTLFMAAHYPDRISRAIIIDAATAAAHPRTRALIKPSLDRLGIVYPSWEAYIEAIKRAPYFNGWWNPIVESYYRADVRDLPDGSVQPRSRPEVIAAAFDGPTTEDWPAILCAITQPTLLFNAPEPYGPPGALPVISSEQAQETANALADCRFVEVPGNHMTMLYGEGARQIVEKINEFLS